MQVQAVPSVLTRDNGWLRLICDGHVRVAPVFPNGLTSLVGASCGFGGDYVAYRLDRQASASLCNDGGGSPICVEFYWWPFRKPQDADPNQLVAFRSVLTLKMTADGALVDGSIALERGFVDHEAIANANYPDMEHWAPTKRVQAVANWESWIVLEGVYARGS